METPVKTAVAHKTVVRATREPGVKPKRLTAAEKRAAEKRAREQEEAQFEKTRGASWLTVWSKVLRLEVMTKKLKAETEFSGEECFTSSHDWWYVIFSVDAAKEQFKAYGCDPNFRNDGFTNQANLTLSGFESVDASLDEMLSLLLAHIDDREKKRMQVIEDVRLRKELLSRLTDKEKALLGVS